MIVADEQEHRARPVQRPQDGAGICLCPLQTSHTTHLGQTRGHCPVSARLGMEARFFGSSPATQDPSAGPGPCLLVRPSEAQGQWSRVTAGRRWPAGPNTGPALLVPAAPTPQDRRGTVPLSTGLSPQAGHSLTCC